MEDEEFEKYFNWIESIYGTNYVRYSLGYFEDYQRKEDRIKRKQKLKEILEEIENNAFSKGMDDVMKNIEMFTPKEAKP